MKKKKKRKEKIIIKKNQTLYEYKYGYACTQEKSMREQNEDKKWTKQK